MRFPLRLHMALTPLVILLLVPGCLERKEEIQVSDDGSVTIGVTVIADSQEEMTPGLTPHATAGWRLEHDTRNRDNGPPRQVLRASQQFAPGMALPRRDGDPRDPDGDLYVQFPTAVTVESRGDGTYYHFQRVYQARPRAVVAVLDERAGHEEIRKIASQPAEQISIEQLESVIRFGAMTEALKLLAMGREAVQTMDPPLAQDRWLAVISAVRARAEAIDAHRLVTIRSPACHRTASSLLPSLLGRRTLCRSCGPGLLSRFPCRRHEPRACVVAGHLRPLRVERS